VALRWAKTTTKQNLFPVLPRCVTRTVLLESLDHPFEIRIAGAKAAGEPVATAFGNPLAVRDHFELTGLTRREDGLHAEALSDEGHETRDLGLIVLSRRAVNDLDLHRFSNWFACRSLHWRLGKFAEKVSDSTLRD
jgi:hypothetical protein